MRTTCAALAIAMLASSAATPALAGPDDMDRMIHRVRAAAAWRGVEVERIRRDGETLRATGHDRYGRETTLEMSCRKLRVACGGEQYAGSPSRSAGR